MNQELFSLRKDQNGLRPVFFLGNERGECHFQCKFCNVRKIRKVTSKENIRAFNEQYAMYSQTVNESHHPVIYNRGNATNPDEFSRKTLNYVLDSFNNNNQIRFISINSREKFATPHTLEYLANKKLNYPIHFILGIESFSKNTAKMLGKNTIGELQRFVSRLRYYNQKHNQIKSRKTYVFGLDANLVFLPELYLDNGETREKNQAKIKEGIKNDLRQLLKNTNPNVPLEINIHPFCRVDLLPYKDAELGTLMKTLPELQKMVKQHNNITGNYQTHLFIGVGGTGYSTKHQKNQIQKWKPIIDKFNQTGKI